MTSEKGKIIILQLNGRLLSLLLRDNRILSAQVHRKTGHAVGDIYLGRVQKISENIGAAFVDLGQGYLTFLSLSEAKYAVPTNRRPDGRLKAGDELAVQIVKEPIKTKLAGVTSRLSLAGKYAVAETASPAAAHGQGRALAAPVRVSSKLPRRQQDGFRASEELRRIAEDNGCCLTVRTNAGGLEDWTPLLAEAGELAAQLSRIVETAGSRTCYSCLRREKPEYIHFVENSYTSEYDEIVTDLPEICQELREHFAGSGLSVRLYEDAMLPLYKLYSVETRIQELLDRKVWLRSGGYLVIEPTEALVSIDVNSGKYEHGRDQEAAYLQVNREAAQMIALQLRARNLSGMILVDFINMKKAENNRQLMEYLKSLLQKDSVPAEVVDMTALGLVEITRKKVNPSFREQYFALRDEEQREPSRQGADFRMEKKDAASENGKGQGRQISEKL